MLNGYSIFLSSGPPFGHPHGFCFSSYSDRVLYVWVKSGPREYSQVFFGLHRLAGLEEGSDNFQEKKMFIINVLGFVLGAIVRNAGLGFILGLFIGAAMEYRGEV